MRVGPLGKVFSSLGIFQDAKTVKDKSESDGQMGSGGHSPGYSSDQGTADSNDPGPETDTQKAQTQTVSEPQIVKAIELFTTEQKSKTIGIFATLVRSDLNAQGLRVVLKNAQGQTIRELSGEEFVKFQDSLKEDKKPKGRIFDQKV